MCNFTHGRQLKYGQQLYRSRKFLIPLLGYNGSGKGTNANAAQKAFEGRALCFTMSEELSDAKKRNPELKELFDKHMQAGTLVPDGPVMDVAFEAWERLFKKYDIIFSDGNPRTPKQWEMLRNWADEHDILIPGAIHVDLEKEIILSRLEVRRICPECGVDYTAGRDSYKPAKKEGFCDIDGAELTRRADDNPEKAKRRMNDFDKLFPLIKEGMEQDHVTVHTVYNGNPQEARPLFVKIVKQMIGE